jgi:hypothetical protein
MMRVDGSIPIGGEERWFSFPVRGKATLVALLLKFSAVWDELPYRGWIGAHCRDMDDMKASGTI